MSAEKGLISTKELDVKLEEMIKDQLENRKLQQEINKKFAEKGLDQRIAKCLFNGTKLLSAISEMEKMTLANCCYYFLENEDFDLKKYYEPKIIIKWENYREVEERIDVIKGENFRYVNDFEYHGDFTYEQVYEYMRNSLWLYYPETQRSGSYNNKRKKGCIREVTINKKAVNEIANLILDGKFEATEIILNCMQFKGHNSKFKFVQKYKEIKTIGDIVIKPNYDSQDDYYTICTILDGYHRILGICKAYEANLEKNNPKLEGCISCKLVLADLERAKRIVTSVFKRTDDDKSWLATLDVNDYTKFADKLITDSSILRNNVSNVYEECRVEGTLTYKALLIDTIKRLDIDVANKSNVLFTSKEIVDHLDLIYSYIESEKEKDNEFYKYMNNSNMFAGYITLAYQLRKVELSAEMLINIRTALINLDKKKIESFKLNYKQYKAKIIIDTFKKIAEEVV